MKKVELTVLEEIIYPKTKASVVSHEHSDVESELDKINHTSSTIIQSHSTSEVGVGDCEDLSFCVRDGFYEGATLFGRTLMNVIQEPSHQDIILPHEFQEGVKATIDHTKDTGTINGALKGKALINVLPDPTLRNSITNGVTIQKTNVGFDDIRTTDGKVKRMTMKGQTLINLLDSKATRVDSNVHSFGGIEHDEDYFYSPKTSGQIQIRLKNNSPFEGKFEDGKTYTLIMHITGSDKEAQGADMYIGLSTKTHLCNTIITDVPSSGILKVKFKPIARETPVTSQTMFQIGFYNRSNIKLSRDIMVLEGDCTNEEIPYFQGMKSIEAPTLKTWKYPTQPIKDGMICWLDSRFIEENRLVDQSGNDNYMDIIGNYKVENDELDLSPNAWTRINPNHTINLSKDFTLMFKVRIKETMSPWGRVLTMSKTGNSNLETLRFEHGASSKHVYVNNKVLSNLMTLGIHDVVVTKSGSNVTMKMNDNVYQVNNVVNFSDEVYKEIGFNCENISNFNRLGMTVCNFYFYNRVLSDEEIQHNRQYEQSINRAIVFEDCGCYKSNVLTCGEDFALREVDGLKDMLDLTTGKFTRRIGHMVLDGTNDLTFSVHQRENTVFLYSSAFLFKKIDCIICDKVPRKKNSEHAKDTVGIENGINDFRLSIDKSDYGNKPYTVQGFKEWLSENPLTIQYQLRTEVVEMIEPLIQDQDNQQVSVLNAFENGYIEVHSQGLTPKVDYEIPTDNSYHVDALKANKKYTAKNIDSAFRIDGVEYDPSDSEVITSPSSLAQKILVMSERQTKPMLIEGDVAEEALPYFQGLADAEPTIVATSNAKVLFGKGGRK